MKIISEPTTVSFPTDILAVSSRDNHRSRDSLAARAFKKHTGLKAGRITHIHDGKSAHVYRIETEDNGSFALKIGAKGEHDLIRHELLFNEIARRSGMDIPVPVIHTADFSKGIAGQPFLISTWLPGESIKKCASTGEINGNRPIFAHLGAIVSRIHACDTDTSGFGYVKPCDITQFFKSGVLPSTLHGIYETPEEYYTVTAARAAGILRRASILNSGDFNRIERTYKNGIPADDNAAILHGDLSFGNVLTDGNVITGIIDGSCIIGYRAEEVAALYMYLYALSVYFGRFSHNAAFESFMSGYSGTDNDKITDELLRFFLIFRIIVHMALFVKKGSKKYITAFSELLKKQLITI